MRETFTDDERARLLPHVTSLEDDVFGLKLPQEVAGALFSRYSRSAKPLRRVFLEEFAAPSALTGSLRDTEFAESVASADAGPPTSGEGLERARAFYDRVLVGYGDDSVAQLGGAHVACENVSNVAAKLLEDARIGAAFLEKSTRYVRFDQKGADGDWLFHKEARILASRHRDLYLDLMERLFSTYARQLDPMVAFIKKSLPIESVEARHPKTGEPVSWAETAAHPELRKQAERAYASTARAHACDVVRGYLPGATKTNVGIFATGQAYELLLTKLASQDLAEGRALGDSMRRSLDQLIPSFVKRAGPSEYLPAIAAAARRRGLALGIDSPPDAARGPRVTLVSHDPDAEAKVLAALLYPYTGASFSHVAAHVATLSVDGRRHILAEVAGARRNRRDKPPRAFENATYTFDLVGNFGIYRDLQRHRLLTQERQAFTTAHGFDTPPEIEEVGFAPEYRELMERAHDVCSRIAVDLPLEAAYAVPFAFRTRWYMTMNLREAVHLCELRSMPQGHPDYRLMAQEIWRRIEEVHPALASIGRFVNRDTYRLGRLSSELRTEYKRSLS